MARATGWPEHRIMRMPFAKIQLYVLTYLRSKGAELVYRDPCGDSDLLAALNALP